MLARTKDLDAVQRYLGHRDRRSTELYAKVQDTALIEIARRSCLHPACKSESVENPFLNQWVMASLDHLSWHRTWDWLVEVESLRLSLSRGVEEPLTRFSGALDGLNA